VSPCPGPLIWYEMADDQPGALLECAAADCTYLIVSGSVFDEAHTGTPVMREGLAA
jgi:hypothetical protein